MYECSTFVHVQSSLNAVFVGITFFNLSLSVAVLMYLIVH